jgi:RimJ/RimL family protein N-acetyltransferase
MDPLPYEMIAGDGVLLRPPRPEDADDLAACADLSGDTPADGREFVIAEPGTGRVVGGCRLYHLSPLYRSGEIAYWVAPCARGRGLATRAATALTRWAFQHGLGRIEALPRPDNPAGQRVAIAAGYRWEGRRRGAGYGRDGRRHDLSSWVRLGTDPAGPGPRPLPDLPGNRLGDGVVDLCPLGPADTADLAALRALPEVVATTVGGGTAEIARVCAEAEGEWLAGNAARLTIRDAAGGVLAGEIGWAFAQAGLARLIAGTAPGNVASQRVLERAGFVREGYQRGRLPGPAGTRTDDILYALLPGTG